MGWGEEEEEGGGGRELHGGCDIYPESYVEEIDSLLQKSQTP